MAERRDEFIQDAADTLWLQASLQTLWRYRRVIVAAFAVVVLCYVAAASIMFALAPRETFAALAFRLTFEGADQDKYPNGATFSSAEIISTPVLSEVFTKNDLQKYVTFPDLKDAIFVLQANPDVELLSYEYQSKLADPKLTPVDRSRIEEEFRKKRESLKSAFFSLNFRRASRTIRIPGTLLEKVLQDTISTWAQQAAERKGATRYNIAVLSKNTLKRDFLAAEEYVVAVDILRSTTERVLESVDAIAKVPGAQAARLGAEQVALEDVRAHLQDLIRFKAEPLVALIRNSGLSRNAARADMYFADRLLEVQLAREEIRQRVAALQNALDAYQQRGTPEVTGSGEGRVGSVTPQVTESFIDRLVQLSSQANDVEYRQDLTNRIIQDGVQLADLSRQAEYYEAMRKAFATTRSASDNAVASEVNRRIDALYSDLAASIDQVGAIFKLISDQNLNPNTVLYSVTSPFSVRTTSSLTLRTLALYLLLTLFAAAILIPLACLAHDYFRHWISPTHPADHDATRPGGSGHVAGV